MCFNGAASTVAVVVDMVGSEAVKVKVKIILNENSWCGTAR